MSELPPPPLGDLSATDAQIISGLVSVVWIFATVVIVLHRWVLPFLFGGKSPLGL